MEPSELLIENSETLLASLEKGSAVLLPTDTVPALASLTKYTKQLWVLKNRPQHKPFILMGSSPEELIDFVSPNAFDDAWKMANHYWPGALTLVLPASGHIVNALNPGAKSIGIRVPANQLTRIFLNNSGPLATTSVNPSGEKPAISAQEAASYFPRLPLLGPVPWPKPLGQVSTVIEWKGAGNWQLLRRGAVMPESFLK